MIKYPSVLTDYTGMNEVMLNAEIAWNSIKEEAMIKEYVGIKNESMVLVEEAKEGFFEAIKKFFRKIIESIKKVIINIKKKLMITLDYYGKFADSAKKKFEKFGTKVKVKGIFSYNPNIFIKLDIVKVKNEVTKMIQTLDNSMTTKEKFDKYSKIAENIFDNLMEKNKNFEKEIEITDKVNCILCINILLKSKDYLNTVLKIFNDAAKAAKDGENSANKEDKEAVELAKLKTTFLNKIGTKSFNLDMLYFRLCASYIKDCLRAVIESN